MQLLWGSRFSPDKLRDYLGFVFGNVRMCSLQTPCAIVAIDLTRQKIKVFDHQDDTLVVDAIMASSAAPLMFPDYQIDGVWYTDGGWCSSNPSQVAHVQVMRFWPDVSGVFRILNIGTGEWPSNKTARTDNAISTLKSVPVLASYDTNAYAYSMILGDRYHRLSPMMNKWISPSSTDVESMLAMADKVDIEATQRWIDAAS